MTLRVPETLKLNDEQAFPLSARNLKSSQFQFDESIAHHKPSPVKGIVLDRASKEVFINFMSREQDDPEIVMKDLVDDMVDNKKYINYTDPDEWLPFFSSMQNLVKQICRQSDLQQKNYKSLKSKFEEQSTEKELIEAKFSSQQADLDKVQLDYEKLASDTKKLVSVEKLFNELKQKYKVMDRDLEQKTRLIADIKPQLT